MKRTFSFDLKSSSDEGKKSGIEGDSAVTVEGHVHTNQALWPKTQKVEEKEEKKKRK